MIAIGASIGLSMILVACFMKSYLAFLFLFANGFGFCNGLTYMVPMQHGWLWFADKPGLISGFITGGFGLGAFVMNFVCAKVVNPGNEMPMDGSYSEVVNERVPTMLLVFACSCASIALVAAMLIYPGKDPVNKRSVKNKIQKSGGLLNETNFYEPPE